MKKITLYLSALLLTLLITNVSMAQSNPRQVTDQSMIDRLNKDWASRNQNNPNPSINWYQRADGYYGTYYYNSTPYMSFYDKDGKHFQTYKKAEWDKVPTTLRSSYNASKYKDQDVKTFWESTDPNNKGYYLEVEDNNGNLSHVWVDDRGQFSTNYGVKPKN